MIRDDGRLVVATVLPGDPTPWERQRATVRNGKVIHFTSREQRAAQAHLAEQLRAACRYPETSFDLAVDLTFRRATKARVDIDNLEKQILDAAKDELWKDDAQIVDLHARKILGCGSSASTAISVSRVLRHDPAPTVDNVTELLADLVGDGALERFVDDAGRECYTRV